jgi:hypothetical protein
MKSLNDIGLANGITKMNNRALYHSLGLFRLTLKFRRDLDGFVIEQRPYSHLAREF